METFRTAVCHSGRTSSQVKLRYLETMRGFYGLRFAGIALGEMRAGHVMVKAIRLAPGNLFSFRIISLRPLPPFEKEQINIEQ
jgi:hypothetical protein